VTKMRAKDARWRTKSGVISDIRFLTSSIGINNSV
jgi:hypothetical protein